MLSAKGNFRLDEGKSYFTTYDGVVYWYCEDKIKGVGADYARRVLQRFKREAKATAALRSPHTIEVYDFGVTGDGHFFYAMEFLDGLDLQSLVEQFGAVPAERVDRHEDDVGPVSQAPAGRGGLTLGRRDRCCSEKEAEEDERAR